MLTDAERTELETQTDNLIAAAQAFRAAAANPALNQLALIGLALQVSDKAVRLAVVTAGDVAS